MEEVVEATLRRRETQELGVIGQLLQAVSTGTSSRNPLHLPVHVAKPWG